MIVIKEPLREKLRKRLKLCAAFLTVLICKDHFTTVVSCVSAKNFKNYLENRFYLSKGISTLLNLKERSVVNCFRNFRLEFKSSTEEKKNTPSYIDFSFIPHLFVCRVLHMMLIFQDYYLIRLWKCGRSFFYTSQTSHLLNIPFDIENCKNWIILFHITSNKHLELSTKCNISLINDKNLLHQDVVFLHVQTQSLNIINAIKILTYFWSSQDVFSRKIS